MPANTTAEVWLPGADAGQVREGAGKATRAEGVRLVGARERCVVFETGSGEYCFQWAMGERKR